MSSEGCAGNSVTYLAEITLPQAGVVSAETAVVALASLGPAVAAADTAVCFRPDLLGGPGPGPGPARGARRSVSALSAAIEHGRFGGIQARGSDVYS